MLERNLYEHFGIHLDGKMHVGDDLIISSRNEMYILRAYPQSQVELLAEQFKMAEHLKDDPNVATPLKAKGGSPLNIIDGQETVLFQVASGLSTINQRNRERSAAKKLAQFHLNGESFLPTASRNNTTWRSWKGKWIKRLEQLESWYVKKQNDPSKNPCDMQFLLTYPYFMGMTENAIQLMAETAPFLSPEGSGNTICHDRFYEGSWLTLNDRGMEDIKLPADFVYDHFTRDVTEYLRFIAINDQPFQKKLDRTERFLNRYHSIRNLQEWDRYFIISRLIFPAHYFDVIEEYYRSVHDETKLLLEEDFIRLVENAKEYEAFVRNVSLLFFKTNHSAFLPGWLTK